MKYSDYQVMMEKEYHRKKRLIFTTYFFLLLSVAFFVYFFAADRQLVFVGTAFLLDFAGVVYGFRAFMGTHPYWEMQLALKAQKEPTHENVCRWLAAVELAGERKLPAFRGRAPEIFRETAAICRKSGAVTPADRKLMDELL